MTIGLLIKNNTSQPFFSKPAPIRPSSSQNSLLFQHAGELQCKAWKEMIVLLSDGAIHAANPKKLTQIVRRMIAGVPEKHSDELRSNLHFQRFRHAMMEIYTLFEDKPEEFNTLENIQAFLLDHLEKAYEQWDTLKTLGEESIKKYGVLCFENVQRSLSGTYGYDGLMEKKGWKKPSVTEELKHKLTLRENKISFGSAKMS
jgi:hypothetical protein